jgi:hypothetical protein
MYLLSVVHDFLSTRSEIDSLLRVLFPSKVPEGISYLAWIPPRARNLAWLPFEALKSPQALEEE